MLSVGLTGGIASGKSLAARLFEKKGARLIDADLVARQVVQPGEQGLHKIVAAFGQDVISPTGELQRGVLGATVFADPEKRKLLDSILHPVIITRIFATIERFREEGYRGIVMADIPLLFECGLQDRFDKTVLVYADPLIQQHRLMQRDAVTIESARQRLDSQMAIADKRALPDFIIDNNGPPSGLEKQVDVVLSRLCEILGRNNKIS